MPRGDRCDKRCSDCKKDYKHTGYYRFGGGLSDGRQVEIKRFRCHDCGQTWSLLPDELLPYVSLPIALVEKAFDYWSRDGPRLPLSVTDQSSVERLTRRFERRFTLLRGIFSSRIPFADDAKELWTALRQDFSQGEKTSFSSMLRHL